MNLSELSIRHPTAAWMFMSFLVIVGGVSFMRMGVSSMPSVDFPEVDIRLTLTGAAPEVMETQIVDPVEDAVSGVEGVKTLTSTTNEGVANISIGFELTQNIDSSIQEVRARIDEIQQLLPKNMDPPQITKSNPADQSVLWLTASSSSLSLRDLMIYSRDQLKPQFASVPGVGEILLTSYVDPSMRIWVSSQKLFENELTVNDVVSAIQNEHSEPPSGYLDRGKTESNIRMMGEAETAEDFRNLPVSQRGSLPNYRLFHLGQVAEIEAGLADIREVGRAQGQAAVNIRIRKQRGANAVEVADAVKKQLVQIKKFLPSTIGLQVEFDETAFVEKSGQELNFTLLLSALLTALVCWLLLGSWSQTINVIFAIPTSIIGSFIVLYAAGFTRNIFTLLGLTLAISIVVDDAIMVMENIVRHREKGLPPREAAIQGTQEITFAAVASTAAIAAIFLPVAFMRGVTGKFFFQFGVTITVAVLISLIEAITLTPMRSAALSGRGLESTPHGLNRAVNRGFQASRIYYRKTLDWALQNCWKVIAFSLLFFGGSLFTLPYLIKEFSPVQDQSLFIIQIQAPADASIGFTDSKFRQAEDFLNHRPEVLHSFTSIGGTGGGDVVNTGSIFVTMKDKGRRGIDPTLGHELSQQQFMSICRDTLGKIPDINVSVQDMSLEGVVAGGGPPIQFSIVGPSWEVLASTSQKMMDELKKTGLLTDLSTDYQAGKAELRMIPDREQAFSRGVSVNAIGQVVTAMMSGGTIGQYSENGHRYNIRLRLDPRELNPKDPLKNIFVRNNRSELVPLNKVVRLEEKNILQSINRLNRQRAVTLTANVADGKSQSEALKVIQEIAVKTLPPECGIRLIGSSESFLESFRSLGFAWLFGLLISYMVLAAQFDSMIDPISVLTALPFSASGALIALLITRQSINLYSMIGIILLMGIAKKNSILLVDFTNKLRKDQALNTKEALLEACPIRLRPILMTSLATIAGAIPAALSFGPGAETRVSMAIAVIGGLVISTAFTLLVVPCVYSVLSTRSPR